MDRVAVDVTVGSDGAISVARDARGRLQSRQGEYALVQSAPDILVLRRIGHQPAGTNVQLSGEITDRGTLLEILQFLASAHWSGEFIVFEGDVRRSIFLDNAAVILATSTVASERLGEFLYRHGKITKQQFDEAVRLMGPDRRIGEIATQKGWLKANDLYAMLQKQVEEIFYNVLTMTRGAFMFIRGLDAASVPVRVNLPAPGLLFEGVQRIDEWAYFREKIPDSQVIPVQVAGKDAGGDRVAAQLFEAIDGKRTLEEVSRVTRLGEFEATKALFALLGSGAATLRRPSAGKDSLGSQIDGFNDVLREVHRTVDANNVGDEARATLSMFLQGGGAFDELFENAGPEPDGAFVTQALLANLARLKTDDPSRVVQQALHDYVAFALFAAGSVLKREDHQQLARRVQERLTKLRGGSK